MAAFLCRLGRMAFRRRLPVLLVWAVVLAGVGFAASRASAAPPDSTTIPGTESQAADNLLQQGFHANPAGATAQIVFVAPPGQRVTAARYQEVMSEVVAEAARSPQVASAVSPLQDQAVSRDGSTAIARITYKVPYNSLTAATTTTLKDAARQGRTAGLTVEVGGNALTTTAPDSGVAFSIVIAFVILLMTFGALAAAGLPLLTAGIGVGVSVLAVTALGSALGLSATTKSLGLMIGLAVGIDYALFIARAVLPRAARRRGAAHAVQTAHHPTAQTAHHLKLNLGSRWAAFVLRRPVAVLKLHARDRAQLVVIAYQTGLVQPGPR